MSGSRRRRVAPWMTENQRSEVVLVQQKSRKQSSGSQLPAGPTMFHMSTASVYTGAQPSDDATAWYLRLLDARRGNVGLGTLTSPRRAPSTYARQAIKFVGYDVACSPYWAHALQLSVADLLPSFLMEAAVFSMHRAIRKKGLKKEAAKAKGQ